MAEAAAACILTEVVLVAANDIALASGYKKKLDTLHQTVDLICAKLRDAERQKGTEAMIVWLKHLKQVVDEADDVLDEVHFEMLRSEVKKPDRIARKGWFKQMKQKNMEMENVGNDIFQILVSNSLFQDVKRDEYGYIARCNMHDLVHDLALSLSKHENLCLVTVDHYSKDNLRINISFKKLISMVKKENKTARPLHTLFFKGEVESIISFQYLKCLRILKFNGCKLTKIDNSIGELVHLRYLDLSNT